VVNNLLLFHQVTQHNNKTGKRLNTLRPCFDPKQPNVVILGSMARQIDFFSMKPNSLSVINTLSSGLSSVCSRIAIHPKLDLIAGGNSNGKVHVFF
jgi:hypothetical protein